MRRASVEMPKTPPRRKTTMKCEKCADAQRIFACYLKYSISIQSAALHLSHIQHHSRTNAVSNAIRKTSHIATFSNASPLLPQSGIAAGQVDPKSACLHSACAESAKSVVVGAECVLISLPTVRHSLVRRRPTKRHSSSVAVVFSSH